MREIPRSRWPLLSPLLDELLDLDAQPRARRLQQLREQDPELAADLQELLDRQQQQAAAPAAQDFMAAPALALAEAAAAALNHAGQAIGAYTLEREIGQGGMGTVWLARRTDGRFEGQVAIKFLNNGLLGRADAGRFAREGQILARLAHPHIARLIDAGLNSESPAGPPQPYLVLEYIDGVPLDRFCAEHALGLRERVRLFLDVLAAVAHAHNRLILHRDLKPSNILVNQAGEVKLLDFGIAKLLGSGEDGAPGGAATELTRQAGRAFTPRYAAPEQVQGGEVTTATDVYALGVLLYLLLSGRHPTTRGEEEQTTPLERLRTLVEVEPKRLSEQVQAAQARELRGDLDTIVAKALKKLPAERYANAAALAEDLKRWLAHEPITARPDSRAYRVAKFLRRNRVAVAAASLASLALLGSGAVALWKGLEAHEQRAQAEGLIEFMLGDLRKKLEPVGRLDVLDAVGEKALAYYAQQDLRRSDADSLGRRARALHLMGEIADKRGRKSEALAHFNEAAKSTAELLARAPETPQLLFNHGQSVYWVGYAARQEGQLLAARLQFESYLALSEQLVRIEPDKLDWQIELGYAHSNLGVLLLEEGQAHAASPRFEAARAIWLRHMPARPSLRTELSTTLGWLAVAREDQGQLDASIQSHQEKLELLPPASPQQTDHLNEARRAAAFTSLSRLHLHAGRGAQSLDAAQTALTSYANLSRLDRENLLLLEGLAFARMQLVETLQALARVEQAQAELDMLGEELRRLLNADAGKPAWGVLLQGRYLTARALSTSQRANRTVARQDLQTFLLGHASMPQTLDASSSLVLASASLALGDALAEAASAIHRPADQAQDAWRSVLRHIAMHSPSTKDPRVNCLRAQALARLNQSQEAGKLAEDLLASTSFRHPVWVGSLEKMARR